MNDVFDWRRIALLLRNDIVGGYRTWLTRSAGVAAFVLLIPIINALAHEFPGGRAYFWWFYVLLFAWGAGTASSALAELHDRTRNEAYLLLPASAIEKIVSRFALVTLGFFVFFIVFATPLALATQAIDAWTLGRTVGWFPRTGAGLEWVWIGNFLVVQSVFFAGGAWFRKMHFVKIAASLVALYFSALAFAYVVAYLFLPQFRDGLGMSFSPGDFDPIVEGYPAVIAAVWWGLRVLYFAALPVLSVYVAWLRVKEAQVSHGV
jgi:hypothetical protein